MQDRFKFRGQADNGRWFYGSLLYYAGDAQIWEDNGKNYIVKPETVGQCTGLKDKNGTLIYEGDIVLILGDEIPYIIEYEQDRAMFIIHSKIDRVCCNFDNYKGTELEVIGNIYGNKELLEGGNND